MRKNINHCQQRGKMDSIVKRRKLDFLDIVLEAVKICRSNIKEFILLGAGLLVVVLPAQLVFENTWPARGTAITGDRWALWIILLLLEWMALSLWIMGIAVITEKAVQQRPITVTEAVKQAAVQLGRAITTSLLSGVIVAGLSLLFIIPGIVYGTYYTFAPYIVVLRGKYENEALAYSKSLVEGQWWRVFGILLGFSIIGVAFSVPLSILAIRASQNPYIGLIAQSLSMIPSTVLGVAEVVLFLNNESTCHRRVAQTRQRARQRALTPIKRAPSIQEYLDKKRGVSAEKEAAAPKTNVRKAPAKAAKKTAATKKATRTTKAPA